MQIVTTSAAAALTATLLAATASPARAAPACTVEALNALHVPNVNVTQASPTPAGNGLPAHCAVQGTVTTHGEGVPDGRAMRKLGQVDDDVDIAQRFRPIPPRRDLAKDPGLGPRDRRRLGRQAAAQPGDNPVAARGKDRAEDTADKARCARHQDPRHAEFPPYPAVFRERSLRQWIKHDHAARQARAPLCSVPWTGLHRCC